MHAKQLRKHFPVDEVLDRIEESVKPYAKAMLFELRARGYGSPYAQLVACVISIRTLDEVSLKVSLRLLEAAPDFSALEKLSAAELADLLRPATFAGQKAGRLLEIAKIVRERHGGRLPCEEGALLELPGIGPKCAHLILGVACRQAYIGVDVHVHRVTNRWGYVHAPTPEKTEKALKEVLPERQWVRINELLVPFGKHICTGARPKCSTCPVLRECAQVGVNWPP
jgi:endonuclease III